MRTSFGALVFAVVLAGLTLVGCDKKVELTFINATPQTRDIQVTAPEGTFMAGTAGGQGGRVHTTLKLKKDELPATIIWQAGDIGSRFTIDSKTKDKLAVPIEAGRQIGPIDKNTEVQTRDQKETIHKETREVVE